MSLLEGRSSAVYQGTKQLKAWPMVRGEYNDYRGWKVPEGENPDDAGYLVEYLDGGKPNDPRHSGYISWSPADVFERTYYSTSTLSAVSGCSDAAWREQETRRLALHHACDRAHVLNFKNADEIVTAAKVFEKFLTGSADEN
jgi:hypothetical protein